VDNKCLQHIKNFKSLSVEISYEYERDFQKDTGNSKQYFKPTLVQKCSRVKVYNALSLHILLYGIEIWTLREKGKND
jgi:hypothetical protein